MAAERTVGDAKSSDARVRDWMLFMGIMQCGFAIEVSISYQINEGAQPAVSLGRILVE